MNFTTLKFIFFFSHCNTRPFGVFFPMSLGGIPLRLKLENLRLRTLAAFLFRTSIAARVLVIQRNQIINKREGLKNNNQIINKKERLRNNIPLMDENGWRWINDEIGRSEHSQEKEDEVLERESMKFVSLPVSIFPAIYFYSTEKYEYI